MADQRTTDLDPIATIPDSAVFDVVDTTNTTQDPAGSSFKITKANLLKEATAAILLNTSKTGITTGQAASILLNTAKVGITTDQAAAILLNTAKVGITVSQAAAILLNTAKTGITTIQAAAIIDNTAKVGITTGQAAAILLNTAKVGITTDQAAAILLNSAKVGITTGQASAITANTAKVSYTDALVAAAPSVLANTEKVGITTSQASAIANNTANTSKVSVNNDAASFANVRSLRYREENYSTNLDMSMETSVGVYAWVNIKENLFNVVNSLITRFKTRVATDGGTFEAQSLTEAVLNSITTLNLASFVMTANSFNLSKIYAAFPNLATSDFSFTRNSTGLRINSAGNREIVAINTPIINYPVSGAAPELLLEPQRTNLLLNSDLLVTQSITTTAAAHALSFTGTGTVTLSGTFSGSLVGTGANNVVSLNFTPTAGTLTVTISGSCTFGQIEAGVNPTANIPTANAAITRVSPQNIIINDLITKGITSGNQGTIFIKLGFVSTDPASAILINLSGDINNPFKDRISISSINGIIRFQCGANNISLFSYFDNGNPISNGRIVMTYLNGVYKLFTNGVLRFTSSTVSQTAYTSAQLTDQNTGGIIQSSRSIKSLLMYNIALTDTQAINLI